MAARGGRAGGGGAARLGPAGALGVGGAGAAAAAGLRAVLWRSSVAGSAASCCTGRRCFLRPLGTGVPLFLFFVPYHPKGFFLSFFSPLLCSISLRVVETPGVFAELLGVECQQQTPAVVKVFVAANSPAAAQACCGVKTNLLLSVCFQTWRVEGV